MTLPPILALVFLHPLSVRFFRFKPLMLVNLRI